jgi:polyketide biosynthesis acyl carrier protein
MPTHENDVATVLRRVILEIMPSLSAEEIRGEASLKDLGADSIDRIEILSTTLARLGVSLPLTTFSDVRDVTELIAVLAASQAGQRPAAASLA